MRLTETSIAPGVILRGLAGFVAGLSLLAAPASAQEPASPPPDASLSSGGARFRLQGEIKTHFRNSANIVYPYSSTSGALMMSTVSPGSSFEVSTVNLIALADLAENISAKVEVHVLDLYNRNPTTAGDRVALREAWIRIGKKYE